MFAIFHVDLFSLLNIEMQKGSHRNNRERKTTIDWESFDVDLFFHVHVQQQN